MAGSFTGFPLGTIGTVPGATQFDPYIAARRIQIEAELDQQRRQQQQSQFAQNLALAQAEFGQKQKISDEDFGLRRASLERQKSMDVEQGWQGQQQIDLQKKDLNRRIDEADENRQRADEALATKTREEADAKREDEDLMGFTARVRSLISGNVARFTNAIGLNTRGESAATPEQLRDMLSSSIDQTDGLTPKEKLIAQNEIAAWYKQESKARDDAASRKLAEDREKRINEDADLAIKIKQDDLKRRERYDAEEQARKREDDANKAAAKASEPQRKMQMKIQTDMLALEQKLAFAEQQMQALPPERQAAMANAVAAIKQVLASRRAEYDALEAEAVKRELDARSRFAPKPQPQPEMAMR